MQRVFLYLYSLENSFLLCKVVASRNKLGVNDEALLKVSLRMFDTVISLWEHRAHYESLLHPLGWLVRLLYRTRTLSYNSLSLLDLTLLNS